jgi:hypothetical protein
MRRARVLLATLGLAVITSPVGAQQVDGPTFQAFEGRTDSYAAGIQTKQLSALALPVEAFLTRTRTEINSQPRAQAYAGVVDIPLGELLGLYGFPEKLPTYCYAQYPGEGEASCGTADGRAPAPDGIPAQFGQGHTKVAGDGFNLDATAADSTVGAGSYSSEQLTVGGSNSRSFSRIVNGTLENGTDVILSQVDIGGGALAFEQVRARAQALTNGLPGGAKAESALTVSGVTVGGQRVAAPAELDLSKLAQEVLGPMAEQLAASGVTVKVLQPPATEVAEDGGKAVASVAGLRIGFNDPATGNRVAYTLGVAQASAVAVRAQDANDEPLDETGPGLDLPSAPVNDYPASEDQTAPPGDASTVPSQSFSPAPATSAGTALPASAPAYSAYGAGGTSGFVPSSPAAAGVPTTPAPAQMAPTPPEPLTAPAIPATGINPELALAATREQIGERVADRLQVFYALGAAAIALLGLLGFRLAHRVRA